MTVEFPPNTSIGRNALAVLAALPLFEDLEPGALVAVAENLEWFCLPGGAILFRQGDEADSLYAVTSGSLSAYRKEADGKAHLVGLIQRGETLGEGAMLSSGVRTATVKSIRDTELIRFSKEAFEKLVQQYPSAMLHIARMTVTRMEQSFRRDSRPLASRSFAVLPNGSGVDAESFARSLTKVLAEFGKTELFTGDLAAQHTSVWFNEVESRRDFVVFVADHNATPWTRQCIGQADSLILLADARDEPRPWESQAFADDGRPEPQRKEMVLLHRRRVRPDVARRWLAVSPTAQHHHLVSPDDFRRFARIITGRAVGLVLSGGGARGFAHIGVIKALREAGIPIDLCGGTSIGSIIASGAAAGWDDEQMIERYRRTFVDRNPLGDYTLPFMSISSGRRVSRLLRGEVGNIDVADLPLSYFCISADLVNSSMVVHRSGLLWRCLRASVAIPGVLPPVFHNKQVLVDGGVVNHLPVDVMRDLGRGPVIGVDVGSETSIAGCDEVDEMSALARWKLLRQRKAPNIIQLLLRAGSLSTTLATAANREQSSILLTPPLQGIDILDWHAFDQAIAAGYRSTMQRMNEIQAALEDEQRRNFSPQS